MPTAAMHMRQGMDCPAIAIEIVIEIDIDIAIAIDIAIGIKCRQMDASASIYR